MALEEERLDAVVTGGNQHATTLGAGHDGGLDVGGVVVLSIALGAAVANVNGKRLRRRGDAHTQLALAANKADQVALAGNQAVDIGLDRVRGAGGLVVDKDLPRIGAGKVAAVVELDHGRAGVAPDNVRLHGFLPQKDSLRVNCTLLQKRAVPAGGYPVARPCGLDDRQPYSAGVTLPSWKPTLL